MLGRVSNTLCRNAPLIRSQIRNGSHGGVPGENLPFSIENKYRLTAMFVVFFGTGLAAPFMVLRHQLLKK